MSNERGFFMGKIKYPPELRLKIVMEYLEGNLGTKALSNKYNIASSSDVKKWIAAYNEHGEAGLCTTRGTYDGQFKINVVEYMHSTGSSARQTAAHFNIPAFNTVCHWERIYLEEGRDALLLERRGRANSMSGSIKGRKPKFDKKENEDLIAELQRLRMENEYLKKLNALVQERENSKKPTK